MTNVDRAMWEYGTHKFCAEASALDLAPGEWPESIRTMRGNGAPFLFQRFEKTADGEVVAAYYAQAFGIIELEILND